MTANFHETFPEDTVKPPSERSTGLTFAVVAVIVALIWRKNLMALTVALAAAGAFATLALLAPRVLGPLTIAWFRFGLLLHKVVNPLVMLVLFTILFIPVGLAMRLFYDPLKRRRLSSVGSYWVERRSHDGAGSMRNQF